MKKARRVATAAMGIVFVGLLLSGQVEAATVNISIVDTFFSPQTTTINSGDTAHWVNNGGLGHTVTADDNTFDSGTLFSGATFDHVFNAAPGTMIPYYCRFHGAPGGVGMSGVIVIGTGGTTTVLPTTSSTSTTTPTSTTTSTSTTTTRPTTTTSTSTSTSTTTSLPTTTSTSSTTTTRPTTTTSTSTTTTLPTTTTSSTTTTTTRPTTTTTLGTTTTTTAPPSTTTTTLVPQTTTTLSSSRALRCELMQQQLDKTTDPFQRRALEMRMISAGCTPRAST